jgi:hypothetical protein
VLAAATELPTSQTAKTQTSGVMSCLVAQHLPTADRGRDAFHAGVIAWLRIHGPGWIESVPRVCSRKADESMRFDQVVSTGTLYHEVIL